MDTHQLEMQSVTGASEPLPEETPLGYADAAAWLARDLLWIDGWFSVTEQLAFREAALRMEGAPEVLVTQRFEYSRADLRSIPSARGQILIFPLRQALDSSLVVSIRLRFGAHWFEWPGAQGLRIRSNLNEAPIGRLATLSPRRREELLAFLDDCHALLSADEEPGEHFRTNFSTVRALLEAPPSSVEKCRATQLDQAESEGEPAKGRGTPRLSLLERSIGPSFVDPESPLGFSMDRLVQIGREHLFLQGWLWDAFSEIASVNLVAASGRRIPFLETPKRLPRSDVTMLYAPKYGDHAARDLGFIELVSLPDELQLVSSAWFVELRLLNGGYTFVGPILPISDPLQGRDAVIEASRSLLSDFGVLETTVMPALARLQSASREGSWRTEILQFGTPVPDPRSSLILPIARELELLEHQVASLADDPHLESCELLYVLDAPELEQTFTEMAFHLSTLYQLPIRAVTCERALGYGAATNLGAKHARGELLVLMHSDVFAERTGWLRHLTEFYQSKDSIGALGAKLLFEDHSIQHAGFNLSRDLRSDRLLAAHDRFKGLPRNHPRLREARRVQALSSACLMISKKLFERLRGFRDLYIAGDLEDVDLCLRCLEEGLENWHLPSAELFHLEGQSRQEDLGWARSPETSLFNHWLLTHHWKGRLPPLPDVSSKFPARSREGRLPVK